ncbi:MAG: hypothetical protein SFU25_11590 [Candidatus Caenarcaniphilales bacterium]|nr:hypothetical protein [Candidatus Caenarcaniphilales bacterium]
MFHTLNGDIVEPTEKKNLIEKIFGEFIEFVNNLPGTNPPVL